MKWDKINVPGLNPDAHYFKLPAGENQPRRLSFSSEAGIKISGSDRLRFWMRSPSSDAMYPDILSGDHGYPAISLTNSRGTHYSFSRGNLKDFFEISTPRISQEITLPLEAFLYNVFMTTNVVDEDTFFDYPLTQISFDFLCHPTEDIDIEITGMEIIPVARGGSLAFNSVVNIEGSARSALSHMMTESEDLTLNFYLSEAGENEYGLKGKPLYWVLYQDGVVIDKGMHFLQRDAGTVNLKLPRPGPYQLKTRIESKGEIISTASTWLCRVLPLTARIRPSILGICDQRNHDMAQHAGGSMLRLPFPLKNINFETEFDDDIAFNKALTDGVVRHSFIGFPEPAPHTQRLFAYFGMNQKMSRKPQSADYDRYAPKDWKAYGRLMSYMAEDAIQQNVNIIETWNEPSVIGSWNDSFDNLMKLHEVTYKAVKDVSSDITVVGGGTHTWDFDFLTKFLEHGGGDHCDGLGVHGYTYSPHLYVEYFDRLETLIETYVPGRKDFGTFITEIGFRTPAFSDRDQALWLSLFTLEAAARSKVKSLIWFRFMNVKPEDLSRYHQKASNGYALLGNSNAYCRPAMASYRHLHDLLQRYGTVEARGSAEDRIYQFTEGAKKRVGRYQGNWTAEAIASIPHAVVTDCYGGEISKETLLDTTSLVFY
jgi:hypothetical protein